MVDKEEVASRQLRANDVADTKDEVQCNDTIGEGVEQPTLSSCEGMTAKDKAEDSRATNATTRVDECYETMDESMVYGGVKGGKEVKVEAGVYNKEVRQSTTKDNEGVESETQLY